MKNSWKSISILVLIIVALGLVVEYENQKLVLREQCDLILEQRVACYKGCKYAILGLPREYYYDYGTWIDMCIKKCGNKYGLSFDNEGKGDKCWYGEEK